MSTPKSSLNFSTASNPRPQTSGRMSSLAAFNEPPAMLPPNRHQPPQATNIPPPLHAPTAPTNQLRISDFLVDGQRVKFEEIYRRGSIRPVPYSADQAIELLIGLPTGISVSVKRASIQAHLTLTGTSGDEKGVQTLIHDAAEKLVLLRKFHAFTSQQSTDTIARQTSEIEALEAQLAEKKAALATAQSEWSQLDLGVSERLDEFVGIISFLDEWQLALRAKQQEDTERLSEATPSFLDEAAVQRLIQANQQERK